MTFDHLRAGPLLAAVGYKDWARMMVYVMCIRADGWKVARSYILMSALSWTGDGSYGLGRIDFGIGG
jgi:hypothetical protein